MTHTRLKKIFSGQGEVEDANWFNHAMKTAGINTCKKQTHVFSQIKVETENFTRFVEILSYRPSGFLKTFRNNCNLKSFYNQNFWIDKTYKKYFSNKVYEFDTTTSDRKYVGSTEMKYIWSPNTNAITQEVYCRGIVVALEDTICIPTNFVLSRKNEIGQYRNVVYSDADKTATQKRLMSLAYANRMGNGDSSSYDGYNFRGRGAVHLTGRDAYRKVSQKANILFSRHFDWEINYKNLETAKEDIIYSGIAFFIWKLNNNLDYLQNNNCSSVTKKVNGGDNGLPARKKAFNFLLDEDFFDCTISRE